MAVQKEVRLEYKDIEIRVLVTETCDEIRIQYFNPGEEDFVEDIREVKKGWRFSDEKLQLEYEELIEKAAEIDEECYKNAENGEVFKFNDNNFL
ncbi:hypothetical protein [Methanobacterium sp. ACI-7]|uniref:hypothetical protein n=1 Tax=unclassified Methanobacterium TaxID=2627676 RepID=UPI0039C1BDBB